MDGAWRLRAGGRPAEGRPRTRALRALSRARPEERAEARLARLRGRGDRRIARRARRTTASPRRRQRSAALRRSGDRIVCLDARGELLDSDGFAAALAEGCGRCGRRAAVFVIGGPDGLGDRRSGPRRPPPLVRPGDLAASARARSAGRAALPRDDHPFRPPLSSGIMLNLSWQTDSDDGSNAAFLRRSSCCARRLPSAGRPRLRDRGRGAGGDCRSTRRRVTRRGAQAGPRGRARGDPPLDRGLRAPAGGAARGDRGAGEGPRRASAPI